MAKKVQSVTKTLLEHAITASKRVRCVNYKVGSVIARDSRILSTGYNGPASGDVHCDDVGCSRVVGGKVKKRKGLCRGAHSELNAIINAARAGTSIEGCVLYVTMRPCMNCANHIVNAGIKHVYYIEDYDGEEEVMEYLGRLGVAMERWDMERDIPVLPRKIKKTIKKKTAKKKKKKKKRR